METELSEEITMSKRPIGKYWSRQPSPRGLELSSGVQSGRSIYLTKISFSFVNWMSACGIDRGITWHSGGCRDLLTERAMLSGTTTSANGPTRWENEHKATPLHFRLLGSCFSPIYRNQERTTMFCLSRHSFNSNDAASRNVYRYGIEDITDPAHSYMNVPYHRASKTCN